MCQFYCKFFNYFLFVPLLILFNNSGSAQKLPDSIMRVLDTMESSENKSYYLNSMAFDLVHQNIYLANKLAEMAEKYADESNKARALGNTYNTRGIIEHTNGNYAKAIKYYYSALRVWEVEKDSAWMAATLNNLGIVYYLMGDYQNALEQYLSSANYSLASGDSSGLASVYNNIGIVLDMQENFDKAYEYYFRGLQLSIANNQKDGMATAYNNIGEVFNQKEIFDSALFYYEKSLILNQEINRTSGIADSYLNFGDVAMKRKEYAAALDYFNNAEGFYLEIGDSVAIIEVEYLRAKTKYFQKKFTESLQHIEKILPYVLDLGNLDNLKRIYELKSQIYEASGDYKSALSYYKLFKEVVDSIAMQEVQNKLHNFELQNEFEKQKSELEIQNIKAQNDANLIIATQKRNWNFVLMAFMVVLVAAGFLYRMSIIRKKINEQLLFKNQQVNEQSEELKQTLHQLSIREQQLMETNKTKDRMFSIIGHDLRGPVGSLQKLLELLTEQYEVFKGEEIKEMLVTARDSSQQTFNLLENLLLWARAQKEDVVFNPALWSIKAFVEENVKLLRGSADIKSITMVNAVGEDCKAFCDANTVKTIFRNLISNAIKFTNDGGNIQIICKPEDDYISVMVIDNGVGMRKDILDKLFVFSQIHTTFGTHNEKGTGLGLKLCYDLALLNHGLLMVKSEEEKGSTFILRLPTNNNISNES